ncbi:hypothetical protein N2152v2_011282 [Parachlorella kessleri]
MGGRYKWDEQTLVDAQPQTLVVAKPPNSTVINYPFSSDLILREHYRSPWGEVRLGRVLEDLDSLAGYVAYDHCDDGDATTRPPLLVTAAVEAIHFRASSRLGLQEDMQVSGRVVWTGRSSLDVCMELQQAGRRELIALFTFAARDGLSLKAHPINQLQPQNPEDRRWCEERQRVAEERKAARAAAQPTGEALHTGTQQQRQWAEDLLEQGRTKADLVALADPHSILMPETGLENTFTCMPQQRNMHGRVFGGFLMRRAYELAHSTAYLFAGTRPQAVEVGEISFQKPVDVGDLIKFKSCVLHAWQAAQDPGKGFARVQVQASVTQPEKLHRYVTNTFNFDFSFTLRTDQDGQPVLPKRVLPVTEEAALEVAKYFGPSAKPSNGFLKLF